MEKLDLAIHEIERFYRTLTGHEAPTPTEVMAPLPPERDPIRHVELQLERLTHRIAGSRLEVRGWTPAASVAEDESGYVVSLDLPGVERDDVEVVASGNRLDVRGRRVLASEGPLRASDRPMGEFHRTLFFPSPLEADRLHAHLREGVLEVRVPRAAGRVGIRSVPIQ